MRDLTPSRIWHYLWTWQPYSGPWINRLALLRALLALVLLVIAYILLQQLAESAGFGWIFERGSGGDWGRG